MSWLGPAISAGGALAGGLISNKNQNKMFQKQLRAQRQFAQNAIQWRAADARAAGISPLAAMGASTSTPGFSITGSGMGDAVAKATGEMGRYIGGKHAKKMSALRGAKENALLDAQTAQAAAAAKKANAEADFTAQQAADSAMKRAASYLKGDKLHAVDNALSRVIPPSKGEFTTPYTGKYKGKGKWTEAEEIERQYGGAAGEIYGLSRAAIEGGESYLDSVYERFPSAPEKIDAFFRWIDKLNDMASERK